MGLICETELYEVGDKLYPCATSITMAFIGGKWKTVILSHLKQGTMRYSELRKKLPVITERTLSIQLKQMEEDGIVNRTVHTSKPPLKVEYSLTDFGKTFIPVLEAIADWGDRFAEKNARVVKNGRL